MKKMFFLIFIGFLLSNCSKEESEIAKINKISSWWNFSYLSNQGRGLHFSFYDDVKRANEFDLIFEWSIMGQNIIVELVNLKDKGPCPVFPSPDPNPDKRCTSDGSIFIPEDKIPPGDYNFIIKSEALNVVSRLNFDGIKYTFIIPDTNLFSVHKKEIYPMPKNILMGSVVYEGEENTQIAKDFINELNSLGFANTIVPNFDKIPLFGVDSLGIPKSEHWQDIHFSRNFVCTMSDNFKMAFDLGLKYYHANPKINIYLSSSHDELARLSQLDGVSYRFR